MKITIEDQGVNVIVEGDDKDKILQALAGIAGVIVGGTVTLSQDVYTDLVPLKQKSAELPNSPTPPRQRRIRRTKAQIELDNAAKAWSDGALGNPSDEVVARAKELGLTPPEVPEKTVKVDLKVVVEPEKIAEAVVEQSNNVVGGDQAAGDIVKTEPTQEEAPQAPTEEVAEKATEEPNGSVVLNILGVTAEDFEGVGKRRDIVRTIMGKGVTELDDVIAVCEGLKEEVRLLRMLGNIPPAITQAYEAVEKENNAS